MKERTVILRHMEPKNTRIRITMDVSALQYLEFPNDKALLNWEILRILTQVLDSDWREERNYATTINHTDIMRATVGVSISAKTL